MWGFFLGGKYKNTNLLTKEFYVLLLCPVK